MEKSEAEWGRVFGTLPFVQPSLIRFLPNLFSGLLSGQRLLNSALLARLQIEGVTLHFFNDAFGLNLALESAESILQ